MIDRLAAALATVAADLSPQQWADAVWLARFLPRRIAPGPEPPAELGHRAAPGPAAEHRSGDGDPATGEPARGDPAATGESAATLHVPSRIGTGTRSTAGPAAPVPEVPAMPDTLALFRALRPLRRSRPSTHQFVVDEQATATHIADSTLWTPVLRPRPVRRFELALVVDTAESMVVWRRTVAELQAVLERIGAFRDIRVWVINSDDPVPRLRVAAAGPDDPPHEPDELVDPCRRRIVLVISDCVGPAWREGSMARLLDGWARSDAVAIIQPLPQRMWLRCGPEIVPARLRAYGGGLPNRELRVSPRGGGLSTAYQGLAVPVLELDPRWLAPWAGLLAGTTQEIDAMVMFTGGRAAPVDWTKVRDDSSLDATKRVYRFRNAASPTAFQLAAYLAATPLSLSVIRLVQHAMLPDSRPAHLAEFFLGGLIYRLDGGAGNADPDDAVYEFHDGVRELLLTRLRRTETLRILHQVADHVNARYGAPREFQALLAAEHDLGTSGLGLPFARVLRQVLTALGGSYARFASRLPPAREPARDPAHAGDWTVEKQPSTGDIEETSLSPSVTRSPLHGPTPTLGDDVSTPPPSRDETLDRPPAVFEGVPTRNPNFTGREELLAALGGRLDSVLTALVPQALHGLGGVGKTQLAVEFCHRFAAHYDLVWWISAEQPALARTTLASLAPHLKLPRSDDQAQTVAAVLEALRRGTPYERWLLVFDNADQPEDLEPLMPDIQGPGHILVTSRNQRWADLAKILEVDVFTREESIRLLERRSPGIAREDADRLAEKLGDLPLALEQAAAWRAETGMPVNEYLLLLDERLELLLAESPPSNYPTSVAATWSLAFERLQDESPPAMQMLELCAFFGAEPISMQLLPMGRFTPSISAELRSTVADPIARGRAMRDLGRYALARVDHPSNSVQVHRLVQAILRERLSPDEAAAYRQGVQEILAAANPGDPDNQETWESHSKLAPHVLPSSAIDGASEDIRRLVLDQIRYFQVRGDFESSRELGELAYKRWQDGLGPNHEHTLVCGRLLAIALRWLGLAERAREINEDTLRRQEAVFGPEHEHSLVTASSLGADLRAAGEWEAARELDERTLAGHRRVFGEDHLNTLQAANNLAVDRRLAGRFAEATELDEDTLERRRRVRGEDHPETLLSYMNLGRDLYGRGDYKGAREQLERAIHGYERQFGPDHPPLLRAYRVYSATLRKAGDLQAAYRHAEQNVTRYRQRLRADHPDTLAATMNLVNSMRAVKLTVQAAEVGRDLLRRYRELSGPTHPFTLACEANLAVVLRQTGDHAEARELDQHAVTTFTEMLGREHSASLSAGNNLANDLYLAGEHEAACRLSKRTFERSREVRGPDDPYTLAAAANHAIDLRTAGDEDGARELESDTWWRYHRVLGERHPETLAAMAGTRIDAEIDPPPT